MNPASYNPLYGKKWAVCGDSFSNGDFKTADSLELIPEGPYTGQNPVYGYLIATRCGMTVQHLARGGRTMALPADGTFDNAFVNGLYQTIDEDVDYITLYFGINDSHHRPKSTGSDGEDQRGVITLGTIDSTDISTFCGAYNVVLEWILENRPFAHLGILVSNGCETDEYRQCTIALAKKWGVPYIDLNGDERTPMMNRSSNPAICEKARMARTLAYRVSPTNGHPSAAAHEFESHFIEDFLRSL